MFVLSTTTHKRQLSAGRKIENKILRLQETQKIYSPSRIEALIDSRKYGKTTDGEREIFAVRWKKKHDTLSLSSL